MNTTVHCCEFEPVRAFVSLDKLDACDQHLQNVEIKTGIVGIYVNNHVIRDDATGSASVSATACGGLLTAYAIIPEARC